MKQRRERVRVGVRDARADGGDQVPPVERPAEGEREVFEDALLNALCRQIHSRTVAARDLVQKMDAAMRLLRMSSGKTVSIAWQLDESLPPERKAAVRLLDFDPAGDFREGHAHDDEIEMPRAQPALDQR